MLICWNSYTNSQVINNISLDGEAEAVYANEYKLAVAYQRNSAAMNFGIFIYLMLNEKILKWMRCDFQSFIAVVSQNKRGNNLQYAAICAVIQGI